MWRNKLLCRSKRKSNNHYDVTNINLSKTWAFAASPAQTWHKRKKLTQRINHCCDIMKLISYRRPGKPGWLNKPHCESNWISWNEIITEFGTIASYELECLIIGLARWIRSKQLAPARLIALIAIPCQPKRCFVAKWSFRTLEGY